MAQFLDPFWPYLLAGFNLVLAVTGTVHALLWKRDGRAVIAWVGLIWLAPIVGAIAYFTLGVNRIRRKAESLGIAGTDQDIAACPPTHLARAWRNEAAQHHPSFVGLTELVGRLTSRPLLAGNRIDMLVDGDEAYPRMLAAIEGAERCVALVSYIFDSDRAGTRFAAALAAANDRGVEVRVLVDDVGSRYSRPRITQALRAAGVPNASFLPARAPWTLEYANLRNHRKILVVDGRIGFTGGTNIREAHWLELEPSHPVRCLHFSLRGPIVSQLMEVFARDWVFTTGESLTGERWFPDIAPAGDVWARGIADGPDDDFEKMQDTILGALSVARSTIDIVTPYFLPNASLIDALNVAAMRGVAVRIIVPAHSNLPVVQWAATAQLWQVLQKGCRVFNSPEPFDHTKLLVVDGVWTLLGSTNWDPRSLRLNFEFNVECYDENLARSLHAHMDGAVGVAAEVTLADVDSRTLPVRIRDGLARLLTPYL